MQIAHQILVLLHLIGFAALLGGVLIQLREREPEVNAAMLYGGYAELLTGVALFAWAETGPGDAPTGRLVIKTVVTVVIVVLVAANRKYASVPRGLWALIGGLTLVNLVLSVL